MRVRIGKGLSLEMAAFNRSHTSPYGPVLYHFPDKARFWSKVEIFSYPPVSTAPVWDDLVGILEELWYRQKSRVMGYNMTLTAFFMIRFSVLA